MLIGAIAGPAPSHDRHFLTLGAPRARPGRAGSRRMGLLQASPSRRWSRHAARPVAVIAWRGRSSAGAAATARPPPSRLRGPGPAGVDRAWSSAPMRASPATGRRSQVPAAAAGRRLMAERIHVAGAGRSAERQIVPVPTARLRSMRGGSTRPVSSRRRWPRAAAARLRPDCLARRGGGRQVGRGRGERVGSPPRIRAAAARLPRSDGAGRRRADHGGDALCLCAGAAGAGASAGRRGHFCPRP